MTTNGRFFKRAMAATMAQLAPGPTFKPKSVSYASRKESGHSSVRFIRNWLVFNYLHQRDNVR